MVDNDVQLPSQDDRFTNRVQFLVAVRAANSERMQTLLDCDATLVEAREEWSEFDGRYYDAPTHGWTPLHRMAWHGDAALATMLLRHGADVNASTGSGWTPLHLVAQMGHQPIAELLLDHGANANAVLTNGLTPLHCAAIRGHAVVAATLLEHDAVAHARDNAGRTPLDWANGKKHDVVVAVLPTHDAQHNGA